MDKEKNIYITREGFEKMVSEVESLVKNVESFEHN